MSRDTFCLLVCGRRLDNFDRLGECFVVGSKDFGLPMVAEGGFGPFSYCQRDVYLPTCSHGRVARA